MRAGKRSRGCNAWRGFGKDSGSALAPPRGLEPDWRHRAPSTKNELAADWKRWLEAQQAKPSVERSMTEASTANASGQGWIPANTQFIHRGVWDALR